MAQPKAFYSYMENEEKLNMLSDEQAGRLYKALYAYSRTGEKPDLSDDPLLAYAFADFVIDIDRDRERFANTCERRAEAGKKGGEAKAANAKNDVANVANATNNLANLANATFATNDLAKPSKSSESESEAEAEAEDNIPTGILSAGAREDFDTFAWGVINLFNKICVDLPKATKLTEHRKRLLYNLELKLHERDTSRYVTSGDLYRPLFERVHKSDKLCGRSDLDWVASFDWIIEEKNAVNILEGNYDNRKPSDKKRSKWRDDSIHSASDDQKAAWEGKVLFND